MTIAEKYATIGKIISHAFFDTERDDTMATLKSNHSPVELASRWDERTSPARFAGNDDVLDTVYRAKRKGNSVFLIRKGSVSLDPFTTVFRGKILPCGEGSMIKGYFSKRAFDYVLLAILLCLDAAFALKASLMGAMTGEAFLWCLGFAVILVLLAIPTPFAVKRYTAFMRDITKDE